MNTLYILQVGSRLLLAGVFGAAAVAKLGDRTGSRRALDDFGLPAALTTPVAAALPIAEFVVACALLGDPTAFYGAVGALGLLIAFLGGIAMNMARGRTPDCHCFGQLHSEPVGWRVLTRNVALGMTALLIVAAGPGDEGVRLWSWLGPLTMFERAIVIGGAAGLALLVTIVFLLLKLVGQNDRLLHPTSISPIDPLAAQAVPSVLPQVDTQPGASRSIGRRAPPFQLPSLDGSMVSLDSLLAASKPIVLVFSDPECKPCTALLPRISQWRRAYAADVDIAVISRGAPEANRAKADEYLAGGVLLQRDREVASDYGVIGTPAAILVQPGGTIGSTPAHGEAEIARLVARTADEQRMAVADPKVATPVVDESPAPTRPPGARRTSVAEFTLNDLDGNLVDIRNFRGQPTVVLFWSPACLFCKRILADLRAWEASPVDGRPQLVIVSSGTVEENRDLGLRSTVLIDSDFAVGRRFGAPGTPSAVLVDEDGRLDGKPVVVGPAIFALLGVDTAAALPADGVPTKAESVEDELLADGTMILYSTSRRKVLTLNGTAALIWECCDGGHTIRAIIDEVRDTFSSGPDVESDVRQLLDKLLQDGMISLSGSLLHVTSSAPAPEMIA